MLRPNDRTVRAPRGTSLNARSWQTEAPLRMLMNNLDPEVAERPQDLVVYGGIGRAARSWEAFDRIVDTLKILDDIANAPGAIRQAGRRISNASRRSAGDYCQRQPGPEVVDLGAFQRARSQGLDDVRPDDGRILDLHWVARNCSRNLRDIFGNRPPPFWRKSRGSMVFNRRAWRHGRGTTPRRHNGGRFDTRGRVPAEQDRVSQTDRLSEHVDNKSG